MSAKKILVVEFDVTNLSESEVDALIGEVLAQAEASDRHGDVVVAHRVVDGKAQRQADKGSTFNERHPGAGPSSVLCDVVRDFDRPSRMCDLPEGHAGAHRWGRVTGLYPGDARCSACGCSVEGDADRCPSCGGKL